MKNKVLRISILIITFTLLIQLTSFAALGKLTLNTKTDKNTYKVNEKVIVTVEWSKEVESAGFVIKYDKDKLSFDSTTLGANYYNSDTAGKILFNWAAFDGKAIKEVTFVLQAKAEGDTTITVQEAKGFADAELNKATEYEYNNKKITITKVQESSEEKNENKDQTNNVDTKEENIKDNNTKNENIKEETIKKDNTISKDKKIPQTGEEITILLTMGIIITCGVFAFVGYRRLSDI